MRRFKILLILLLNLVFVGCSRHWRYVDLDISGEDLHSLVEESLKTSGSSSHITSSDVERFEQIFKNPNTTVYFAESGESMGPPQNVTAVFDWNFLGAPDVVPDQVEYSRAIFLDLPDLDRNQNALLIEIRVHGRRITKIFFNDVQSLNVEPSFYDNGEFYSQMASSDGSVILVRSIDVVNDQLQSVIQLEIYEYDLATGEEFLTGKMTTLVGFEFE